MAHETKSVNQVMPSAVLQQFARKYRLQLRLHHEDGEPIILGKRGHVYEYGEGVLAFLFLPGSASRQWGHLVGKLTAPAFRVVQDCDAEGAAIFDHNDGETVKMVLKICRIHAKRLLSPERLAALKFRFGKPVGGGDTGPQSTVGDLGGVKGQSRRGTAKSRVSGVATARALLAPPEPSKIGQPR